MVPYRLIEKLYLARYIMVGSKVMRHDDVETYFDIKLGAAIHRNHEIRAEVADIFKKVIEQQLGAEKHGIIGVSPAIAPIVAIVGYLTGCPIVTIATRFHHNKGYMRFYGPPEMGYKYTLVDDSIISGETISRAFSYWSDLGYGIENIIVFCDRQEGGLGNIKNNIEEISARTGNGKNIKITSLVTRKRILDELKENSKISSTEYREALKGSTIANDYNTP